jgi:WD40 repeat protein
MIDLNVRPPQLREPPDLSPPPSQEPPPPTSEVLYKERSVKADASSAKSPSTSPLKNTAAAQSRLNIRGGRISPDGRWYLEADTGFGLRVYDLDRENPFARPAHALTLDAEHANCQFTENGRWILAFGPTRDSYQVAGGRQVSGSVIAFKVDQTAFELGPIIIEGRLRSLTLDGRILITVLADGQYQIWDFDKPDSDIRREVVASPFDKTSFQDRAPNVDPMLANLQVWSVTPDGRRLVVSTREGDQLMMLDIASDGRTTLLRDKWNSSFGSSPNFQFSPDSRWFVQVTERGEATLWDLTSAQPGADPFKLFGHQLFGHQDSTTCAAFSPDSRWLATGGHDSTIRLWDVTNLSQLAQPIVLAGHTQAITALRFSTDGRKLFSSSADKSVRIWHTRCEDLVGLALRTVGRELTPIERQEFSVSAP